jgi:hypothetical protein
MQPRRAVPADQGRAVGPPHQEERPDRDDHQRHVGRQQPGEAGFADDARPCPREQEELLGRAQRHQQEQVIAHEQRDERDRGERQHVARDGHGERGAA